jgi:hypothetical protein
VHPSHVVPTNSLLDVCQRPLPVSFPNLPVREQQHDVLLELLQVSSRNDDPSATRLYFRPQAPDVRDDGWLAQRKTRELTPLTDCFGRKAKRLRRIIFSLLSRLQRLLHQHFGYPVIDVPETIGRGAFYDLCSSNTWPVLVVCPRSRFGRSSARNSARCNIHRRLRTVFGSDRMVACLSRMGICAHLVSDYRQCQSALLQACARPKRQIGAYHGAHSKPNLKYGWEKRKKNN